MTERKFTPPTSFPAEYATGNGSKVVILGRGTSESFPFIGYDCYGDAFAWTEKGETFPKELNPLDLHDTPKRITTWHNVYVCGGLTSRFRSRADADAFAIDKRLCVYRIERDADGGNPEIFVEKVEDFKEDV